MRMINFIRQLDARMPAWETISVREIWEKSQQIIAFPRKKSSQKRYMRVKVANKISGEEYV